MPPSTDQKVHHRPSFQAFLRSASTIGISMMSVGMGKKEASAKVKAASAAQALRPEALRIIQSYKVRMRPRLAPASGLSMNVMRALSNAGFPSIVSACRQIWVSLACAHHGCEETKTQNRHKGEVQAL